MSRAETARAAEGIEVPVSAADSPRDQNGEGRDCRTGHQDRRHAGKVPPPPVQLREVLFGCRRNADALEAVGLIGVPDPGITDPARVGRSAGGRTNALGCRIGRVGRPEEVRQFTHLVGRTAFAGKRWNGMEQRVAGEERREMEDERGSQEQCAGKTDRTGP